MVADTKKIANQPTDVEGEPTYNQKLADMSREITVLRVNEAGLVRRYIAVQEKEASLRKQNTSLKSEIIQLESAVTARLGYYSRYKEAAAFQLESLQKQLDRSVPREEHDRLMSDYEQMANNTKS
ncbi:hypothetical protein AHF37_11026 [Paragonimus kellicotti]|nr:hypothetical protein AHF37_11026 [Paragonimus kellicotti]